MGLKDSFERNQKEIDESLAEFLVGDRIRARKLRAENWFPGKAFETRSK